MAGLIYVANVSLDGFIEGELGGFEWTEPDDPGDPQAHAVSGVAPPASNG